MMHIHAHTKQSEWWLTKNYRTPKQEQETRKVENATAWGEKRLQYLWDFFTIL